MRLTWWRGWAEGATGHLRIPILLDFCDCFPVGVCIFHLGPHMGNKRPERSCSDCNGKK